MRRGLPDDLEVSVEGTLLHVEHVNEAPSDTHPNIYMLHGGLRHGSWRGLSFEAGAAVGGSEGGLFVAPNVGVTLAYENRYLVPFISVRGYVSLPVFPREVFLAEEYREPDADAGDGDGGDSGDLERIEHRDTPRTTFGMQGAAGLRLPLRASGEERGSIHAGVGITGMGDGQDDIAYVGAALGLSLLL